MKVTYKIKKDALYQGSPYKIIRTVDGTVSEDNNLDLLIVSIQAMISDKNLKAKELKQ